MKTETQMATGTKQIHLTRRSPNYWRVTIDHPPLNVFGPETIPQLNEVITALETDEDVKVVVFDSAVEGFFLTHYDFLAKTRRHDQSPAGTYRAAASARHAGAAESRSGCVDRVNSGTRDRCRK